MSILDKKLFLSELEKRLGDIATANDVRRIIEQAADVLTDYELTAETPGGSSESDSLIDLFLSAKSIEGRSEKTIDHYRYVLGRLRDALQVPLGAAAGVDNVHPHRFRRTLATNLIAHGMQLPEVAAILGHDKIDTTMTYVHLDQRNVEASYRRLA